MQGIELDQKNIGCLLKLGGQRLPYVGEDVADLDPVALEGEREFFGLYPARQCQPDDGHHNRVVSVTRLHERATLGVLFQQECVQGRRGEPRNVADGVALIDQSLDQGRPQHVIVRVQAVLTLGFDGLKGSVPRFPHPQRGGGYATAHRHHSNLVKRHLLVVFIAHIFINCIIFE